MEGYLIFGDGESKVSLLDLAMGSTIHLMPNTLVGTGRSFSYIVALFESWSLVYHMAFLFKVD